MKKQILYALLCITTVLTLSSCGTRVQPNYKGVLMENYGKNGKSDYSLQQGKVNDWGMGRTLFQVPLWEQRAGYDSSMHLKAADNTEFSAFPTYSYKVIESRAVDVVFANSNLGSGEEFMRSLEDKVLEMRIRDIIKEESRKYTTDTLMANSGSLNFEHKVETLVRAAFLELGLELKSFSSQLEFSAKVKNKIDTRNEVNSNITVLEQKILEQKKQNELAALQAEENIILSRGLTPQILQKLAIETWGGKQPIYGNQLPTFFKSVQ